MPHKPVLTQEVLQLLELKQGAIAVDGTLGNAGHAVEILKRIGSQGRLIGLDQDPKAIERSRPLLKDFPRVDLFRENFKSIEIVLDSLNIPLVNAVLLDVGVSSDQLEEAARGFSFDRKGPLDMRMDPRLEISARDLVKHLPELELARIFREFGGEPQARRIAKAIAVQRTAGPLETTEDLVRTIEKALPWARAPKGNRPPWARRHPATRVFQALRIVVNSELDALREGLPAIWKRLAVGGRIAVITFHSLEDRIVKHRFRSWAKTGEAKLINRKPVTPSEEESHENPRSRSAKLRVVEKIR